MRVVLPLLLSLVLASPADAAPLAKARTTACVASVDRDQRAARFSGDMRSVPGAVRLQIRFTLKARTQEDPAWVEVAAPGFGTWSSSDPGIARFVYVKTVENLLAPASYRAIVHFRWLGPTGKPLLRARRVSRVCRQPDLRPDLVPARVAPEGDGYAVTVTNDGRSDAAAFSVTVESGGRVHELGRATKLSAGGRTTVRGALPGCVAGEIVTIRIDATDTVDEADELDNATVHRCGDLAA